MCGIPLSCGGDLSEPPGLQEDYKVAICEQVEDPKTGQGTGEEGSRSVIVTPGTNLDATGSG